jgi:type I restriction enzyme S subunit
MAAGFPLVVNDIAIRTSEALYQACRFPHRPDVQHEIIAQASPLVAKMKSRKCLRDLRPEFRKGNTSGLQRGWPTIGVTA